MRDVFFLILCLLGLMASTIFCSLQLALTTLVRTRLSELAEKSPHPHQRNRIESILDDADSHALACAVPAIAGQVVFVIGLFLWLVPTQTPVSIESAHTTVPMGEPLTQLDLHLGMLIVAGLLSFFGLWLFSMVVPASIAQHGGETLIFQLSGLVRCCAVLTRPLRPIIGFFDALIRRMAGVNRTSDADDLEAELLSVVEEGLAEGQFDETEQDMIEAVVEFRTTTVEEIMTPRTDIHAMEYSDDLPAILHFVHSCGHSRIPVYKDNLDHIQGVLYAKDLLHWIDDHGDDGDFHLSAVLREAVFVPETKTVRQLMAELLAQKVHLAMVIDEYGGIAGLVTIEDIVEEIFGEIHDEYENPDALEPDISVDPHNRRAIVDARMRVEEANDALEKINLEIPENDDYDTVGGFVVVTLGHIPKTGERFCANGLTVEILSAQPTRVVRVALEPTPKPAEEESGSPTGVIHNDEMSSSDATDSHNGHEAR